MGGVLYYVYRRNRKFAPLHLALIEDLNSKNVTIFLFLFYHGIILLAPSKFIGFGLLASFTGIVYIKIRSFNRFIVHYSNLAEEYKKNSKLVQLEYDAQIDVKISNLRIKHIKNKKN